MLSIQSCRKLLAGEAVSDEDLLLLRDQMYALAKLALDRFQSDRLSKQPANLADALCFVGESDRMAIEERAAVLEFEANLKREDAERLAIAHAIKDWSN